MQTLTTPAATAVEVNDFEARFKAAVKEIRASGVKIRQNVNGCCTGCIETTALGLTEETEQTTPYLFTYAGQGNRYTWRDGLPYYAAAIRVRRSWGGENLDRRGAKVTTMYFNHGGPGIVAAKVAAAAFRAQGLTVEWDGTATQCVIVKTPHAA